MMHCIFLDLWDVISLLMSLDMMQCLKQYMTTLYHLNKSKLLQILVKKRLVILCPTWQSIKWHMAKCSASKIRYLS